SLNSSIKEKLQGIQGFSLNYSYMKASFQSAQTLPAANHPNSVNDVEAGDIIPGMPKHKINASITYGLFEGFSVKGGITGSTGVYLRGDESNQLKKTSPYAVFNLQSEYSPKKNLNFFARIENIFNSDYETMGVLGEASSDEVNVPIAELGDTGSGDISVGPLDPNFLSPGQPRSFFIGIDVQW
ncbi:TonB-dependent receptor, partial [Alphaproteobacteria bacterium]|nr:TonB-dependent receptor [Alphaproteobacteria bacterium]